MPREMMSLQIGQCGNQVGFEFWKRMCMEHGIESDGTLNDRAIDVEDRKDVFFYQADDNHYIPRAILLDLEPKVLETVSGSGCQNLFNQENIFCPKEAEGAGNNWALGYSMSMSSSDELLDIITREAEDCDSFEGFLMCHSIAGGTGSGMGSYLLENIKDAFPRKDANDVVTQPYNSILTMSRLIEYADSTIVIDNEALSNIVSNGLFSPSVTISQMNALIARIMVESTATVRYPSYANQDFASIINTLVSSPRLHFLLPSLTPINNDVEASSIFKSTVIGVQTRLLQHSNLMASVDLRQGCYLSALHIISGDVDPKSVYSSLQKIMRKNQIHFSNCNPKGIQVMIARRSPFVTYPTRVSGLMLANNRCVGNLFRNIANSFDRYFKRDAFIHNFLDTDLFANDKTEFVNSRNTVEDVIREYNAVTSKEEASNSM